MPTTLYISKLNVNGQEYEIKDTVARQGGVHFILSTDAASTPLGVTWIDRSTTPATTITGTLAAANADAHAIYLVPGNTTYTTNIYREFIVVTSGGSLIWEQMGDTEVDLKDVVTNVTLNKSTENALGINATFESPQQTVSVSGQSTTSVLKGVTVDNKHLELATITGINGSQSITPVTSATDVSIPNVSLGAAQTASHIVTEEKTATNTVFGTDAAATRVHLGTDIAVATTDTQVANLLQKNNTTGTDVTDSGLVGKENAYISKYTYSESTETLSLFTTGVGTQTVTPAKSNGTIKPTIIDTQDVVVPQVTSNTSVTSRSVKTNSDVSVPVVNIAAENLVATKVVLGSAVNLAKPAGAATTVATGSLTTTGTGASIVAGVTTPSTDKTTVVDVVGTLTVPAHTVNVTDYDSVKVLDDATTITVTKAEQSQ